VRAGAVLIGEIGLAGELRMPGHMQTRLREAAKLGFKSAIVPRSLRSAHSVGDHEGWPQGLEIVESRSIQQAVDAALMPAPGSFRRAERSPDDRDLGAACSYVWLKEIPYDA